MPPGLLILAALDLESRALAAALGLSRTSKTSFASPNGSANPSSVGPGPLIELHTIGLRATSMPGTLTAPILLAGLAGGLDPTLRTGDLITEGCPPRPGRQARSQVRPHPHRRPHHRRST